MNLNLDDKVALVTGSTKGIGFAIANQLAQEGARVIVNGRAEKDVAAAIAQIRQRCAGAKLEGFAADLSTAEACEALRKRFSALDILVNNIGIYQHAAFEEITDEEWRRFFEVNVMSGVRLCRTYLPGMKERNWGRIILSAARARFRSRRR